MITQKQLNYLIALGAKKEDIVGLNIQEASKMIRTLLKGGETAKNKRQIEVKPEHSLKVGDILVASWGYEQTNLNFFKVVKVCGKTSVRVVEVYLPVVKESEDYYCSMSRDASFNIKEAKTLVKSHFINDQENGDLKKVKNWNVNKDPEGDYISIESFASAHKYNSEKLYESWYY